MSPEAKVVVLWPYHMIIIKKIIKTNILW